MFSPRSLMVSGFMFRIMIMIHFELNFVYGGTHG